MTQYDNISKEYSDMEGITKKYVFLPSFLSVVGNIKGIRVADLACGSGYYTRTLANLGAENVVGVDISSGLIDIAKKTEAENQQGIEYYVQDVSRLYLEDKFDLITSVFLLNYAKTEDNLKSMCDSVHNYLTQDGRYIAIVPNPNIKPMIKFEYDRMLASAKGKDFFEDGDEILLRFKEIGSEKYISNYFWSKETYERCLRNAGFKDIQWQIPEVSKEGKDKFGKQFWNGWSKNPTAALFIAKK